MDVEIDDEEMAMDVLNDIPHKYLSLILTLDLYGSEKE